MTEAQHQAHVFQWSRQPEIRAQWPELARLFHIPNGGRRDAMSGVWTFPWEELASRGAEVPEGLSLPDRMAYMALRGIYGEFYGKRMDREQAVREKGKLRREWEQAKAAEAFAQKQAAYHVRLRRAVEQASTACRKEPTKEHALRLCDVIDGLEGA